MLNFKYSYNPPYIIKSVFSNFQWDSTKQKILITFDDGPNAGTTEIILRELNKYSLKTIFFCVGENFIKFPSLTKEILSEGHDIGNHTFNHSKLTLASNIANRNSIEKVQDYAQEKFSYTIKYFRPPHGRFSFSTNRILNDFNLTNIMWSLLTHDYKNDINIVKFAINKYLSNNSIVVFHDNIKSQNIISDSINILLEKADKNNLQIGKPSECLRYYS